MHILWERGSIMTDELWASIERKMRSHNVAAMNLPVACSVCGSIMTPFDLGYDPSNDTRAWRAECCGNYFMFEEKVRPNFNDLVGE
jgi:hypothetical protein